MVYRHSLKGITFLCCQAGGVPRYDCLSHAALDGHLGAQGTSQSSSVTPRKPHQQLQQCFNCGSLLHGLKARHLSPPSACFDQQTTSGAVGMHTAVFAAGCDAMPLVYCSPLPTNFAKSDKAKAQKEA